MNQGYLTVLRHRNFMWLWLGQTTSQFGDALYDISLVWLTLQLSNQDPASVGFILFARFLPYPIFGLIAGAYSDRLNRKHLMIVCDVLRAVILLTIPALHVLNLLSIWNLAAGAFILTVLRSFFHPALQASVPNVVPESLLVSANAALHASLKTASVVGPIAAGELLTVLPAHELFLIDSLSFAASALTILFVQLMPTRQEDQDQESNVLQDVVSTARLVFHNRVVFWSITLFGVGLLAIAGAYRVGLPVYADQVLKGDSAAFGLLMGTMGFGTVVGALIIERVALMRTFAFGPPIFLGWMLWGACFVLVGLSTALIFALLFTFLAGLALAVIDIMMVSLIQTSVAKERMGKVFSFWSTIAFVGESASAPLTGFFLGVFSSMSVFVACGIATIAVGGLGLIQMIRKVPGQVHLSRATAIAINVRTSEEEESTP